MDNPDIAALLQVREAFVFHVRKWKSGERDRYGSSCGGRWQTVKFTACLREACLLCEADLEVRMVLAWVDPQGRIYLAKPEAVAVN